MKTDVPALVDRRARAPADFARPVCINRARARTRLSFINETPTVNDGEHEIAWISWREKNIHGYIRTRGARSRAPRPDLLKNSGESRTRFALCQKICRSCVATHGTFHVIGRISWRERACARATCQLSRGTVCRVSRREIIGKIDRDSDGWRMDRDADGSSILSGWIRDRSRSLKTCSRLIICKKCVARVCFFASCVWIIQQLLPIALLYTVAGIPVRHRTSLLGLHRIPRDRMSFQW